MLAFSDQKVEAVGAGVRQFCEAARARFGKCDSFETRRQFLLDHVEKVVVLNDRVSVYGSVPIQARDRQDENEEAAAIEFKMDGRIKRPSIRRG